MTHGQDKQNHDNSASTAGLNTTVAVDVVLLTVDAGALWVTLYQRIREPHIGGYSLPGGLVRSDESLDEAAHRVLAAKVGISGVFLEQLYTFGDIHRDPRSRTITVAYYALVDANRFRMPPTDPTATDIPKVIAARIEVPWSGETGGPVDAVGPDGEPLELVLDHADILGLAIKRLRGKLDYTPVGFQLLPEEFTLRELQTIHEVIRGEPLNKDSFRRRMLASHELEATGAHERNVAYRPAELYRFCRRSAT
jgi:8-oxo-dGTP diphosphatase